MRSPDEAWTMTWHGWKLKIYIAARFKKQALVRQMADDLDALGCEVTSRWRNEPDPADLPHGHLAMIDLEDVRNADILLLLGDVGGAGRYFEAGYAYALGRPVFLVGDDRMIFKHLPNVRRFDTLDEALTELTNKRRIK